MRCVVWHPWPGRSDKRFTCGTTEGGVEKTTPGGAGRCGVRLPPLPTVTDRASVPWLSTRDRTPESTPSQPWQRARASQPLPAGVGPRAWKANSAGSVPDVRDAPVSGQSGRGLGHVSESQLSALRLNPGFRCALPSRSDRGSRATEARNQGTRVPTDSYREGKGP